MQVVVDFLGSRRIWFCDSSCCYGTVHAMRQSAKKTESAQYKSDSAQLTPEMFSRPSTGRFIHTLGEIYQILTLL